MFTNVQVTSAYHLEALSELRTMHRIRKSVLVALRARFWICVTVFVPFMLSKRTCRVAGMRALCVKVRVQCLSYIT